MRPQAKKKIRAIFGSQVEWKVQNLKHIYNIYIHVHVIVIITEFKLI